MKLYKNNASLQVQSSTLKSLAGAPRQTMLRMSDLANTKHGRGLIGLSPSTIYRKIEQGAFPKPRQYPNSRAVYWTYGDILDWQQSQSEEVA